MRVPSPAKILICSVLVAALIMIVAFMLANGVGSGTAVVVGQAIAMHIVFGLFWAVLVLILGVVLAVVAAVIRRKLSNTSLPKTSHKKSNEIPPFTLLNTALMYASWEGNLQDASQLLKQSTVDIDRCNRDGQTALMIACSRSQKTVVELLLGHGANAELADRFGKTPIDYAQQAGNDEIIAMLQQTLSLRARGT